MIARRRAVHRLANGIMTPERPVQDMLRRAFARLRGLSGDAPAPDPPAPRPRRVLITQRELKNFGGSEFFAIEVARALKQRGNEVAIYCPCPGRIADIITPSGVPVCKTPDAVPFVPDIIHGQHHLPTMAALARFPGVPAIYCWHGARPWVEQPPVDPRIRYYVVTSARMAPRLSVEKTVPEDRIVTIPNFVELDRFSRVRAPVERWTRAVLYGHGGFSRAELETLESACADHGLALDKVGYPYDNPRPRPEYFLPDYDLAFAIGRCALEALASGCAVLPIVPQLAGSLVTPDTLDDWTASNFSPRYFTSAEVLGSDWLGREIARASVAAIREVSEQVRARHAIAPAIDAFEALYDRARDSDPIAGSGPEFARYMAAMAVETDAIWGELECRKVEDGAADARARDLERRLGQAERRVRWLTGRLLPGAMSDAMPGGGEIRARIAASGQFDADWYRATYPQIGKVDPLEDYLSTGGFCGREPSPGFDSPAYLAAHPDLAGSGITPLEHFVARLALVRDTDASQGAAPGGHQADRGS